MNRNISITILLFSAIFLFANTAFSFDPPAPPIQKIIIDPGYGGNDEGPLCKSTGLKTKDINLSISKKLAQTIIKKLGLKALLTRGDDTFLHLDERTSFANMENGDLFISIHTNSSENTKVYGIEIFIMNKRALNRYTTEVKSRDNPPDNEMTTVLENIIGDIQVKNKAEESESLAKKVQQSLSDSLSKKYSDTKSRGVKRGPFYVLIGANMPSIVIATGFVSNTRECKRLSTDTYQNDLAEAISIGVESYIEKIKKAR